MIQSDDELSASLGSDVAVVTEVLPLTSEAHAEIALRGIVLPEALGTAVISRQEDYLGGRLCAARALSAAGSTALCGRSTEGIPVWPTGFTGSIAHTLGLAVAVAASGARIQSLGVDVEPLMEKGTEKWKRVLAKIGLPEEQVVPAGWNGADWTTLVFSAKESLFKALYPLVGRRFGFGAARITLTDDGFGWELGEDLGEGWGRGSTGEGALLWRADCLLSGVCIPR